MADHQRRGFAVCKEWVPVDFGDAQLSVPASWKVSTDCASSGATGTILLLFGTGPRLTTGLFSAVFNQPGVAAGAPLVAVGAAPTAKSPAGIVFPPVAINGIALKMVASSHCDAAGYCPT